VTLISPYFQPEHSGSAPYVTQVAEHLANEYNVTVLTGVPHYPEWRIAPGYDRWRSVEARGQLHIRRLRHLVPTKQTALTRALYEASFAVRVLLEGIRLRSDVVIAFTPPVMSTAAAAALALVKRARLGVVVHDLAGLGARQSGIRGGASVARLVGWIEGRTLNRADSVVVLHRLFVRQVTEIAGVSEDRVRVIRNWSKRRKPTEDRETTRAGLGWGPDECVVVHSGNMGMKQGLENVVRAAQLADERQAPVRFVLMGDGNQRSALEELARGTTRLNILPPAEEGQFVNILHAADMLLVNERPGVSEMSVPSKLTAYFAAGRPVVLASTADSPAASEVAEAGAGPRVDSGHPEALLDMVLDLHGRPEEATRAGAAGRTFADQEFDAARALHRYSAWVDELAHRAPPRE
jgi:glycosyltransferase involved in cell wall biosynthesis